MLQLLMQKPGKDESSVLFHFCSSGGKNALLIATDNYLNTGISEIQEFAAGSLTV